MEGKEAGLNYTKLKELLFSSLYETIKILGHLPFKVVLDLKESVRGVYIIFSKDGKVLYVGMSANIPQRLRGHLWGTGLVGHIMKDRGIPYVGHSGHRCKCGRFTECGEGSESPRRDEEFALDGVMGEVVNTCTVSFIKMGEEEFRSRAGYLEGLVYMALDPKYGVGPSRDMVFES